MAAGNSQIMEQLVRGKYLSSTWNITWLIAKICNVEIMLILSGGNMDVITFSSVVQHGLIARSRIFTVSVLLPDKPGELQRVAGVIAGENGNIIKLEHNQFVTINRNSAVELVITIEAFGPEHKEQILRVLSEQGYRPIEKKPKAIF